MADHTKLHVWQRAMTLSIAMHQAARGMSWRGAPGLRSQLLRAAASIPANIAEGAGQLSEVRFAHFLSISIGSANEVHTHLELARGIGMLDAEVFAALFDELSQIRRMLIALRQRLLAATDSQ